MDHMSRLVLSALIAALASATIAAARPNTTAMSCAEAASTVARAGAIVLSTGAFTYQRFVAEIGHCMPRQTTGPGLAPTRDNPSCEVGFICTRQDWFMGGTLRSSFAGDLCAPCNVSSALRAESPPHSTILLWAR
jgi:hypothetical protein